MEDTPDTSGEEELVYEDNHWRSIHLQPIGMSWETRVQAIARAVVANPDTSGKGRQAVQENCWARHYLHLSFIPQENTAYTVL